MPTKCPADNACGMFKLLVSFLCVSVSRSVQHLGRVGEDVCEKKGV